MKGIVKLVKKERTKNKVIKGISVSEQLNNIMRVRTRVD